MSNLLPTLNYYWCWWNKMPAVPCRRVVAVASWRAVRSRCLRRLDAIDQAVNIKDLGVPGFSLHELKGNRRGTWSIHINGPFCITFRFFAGDAYDVDLENYH